jgi:hypothetical protein
LAFSAAAIGAGTAENGIFFVAGVSRAYSDDGAAIGGGFAVNGTVTVGAVHIRGGSVRASATSGAMIGAGFSFSGNGSVGMVLPMLRQSKLKEDGSLPLIFGIDGSADFV